VTVLRAAIVDAAPLDEVVRFSRTIGAHTAQVARRDGGDGIITVPAMTLDKIVRAAGFASYVLVCDIEGAEWDALPTSAALSIHGLMIIELHDVADDPQRSDYRARLQGLIRTFDFRVVDGYGHVCVLGRGGGPSAAS
jgi:hypothetical protein